MARAVPVSSRTTPGSSAIPSARARGAGSSPASTCARVHAITRLDGYRDRATLYLGGVPMIASDSIDFIRSDLKVFGAGVVAFIVVILAFSFGNLRWVVLPLAVCVTSAASMCYDPTRERLIVRRTDAKVTESDLIAWARDRLAGFKVPREIIFLEVTEMPRNATGKILHRVLRENLAKRRQHDVAGG